MQDIKVTGSGGIILLGKQGENLARQIRFDISRWISTFGRGTVQLLHQRSGDETPYPVAVEQEGNLAVWTVTNADTAAPGTGYTELQYYVGDTLAKSETWMTKVLPALGDASEPPPEAQQGWVEHVLAEVARITGMTAQAVELPAGSAPTAEYADGVLTIGIPLGGDVSETQIAQAVAEYLETHPIAETDPTVPAWAKAETKPSYTAAEVGADPAGTAAARVSEHNTETTAHSDMRLLIKGLTDRLNALADSDDTTLDQLSEIVAYIKSNRDLIDAITTDKVSVTDIVNDLVTNAANKPLSAAQGVALKALIDSLNASDIGAIPAPATASVGQTIRVSAVDDAGQPTEWEAVDMASGGGYSKMELLHEITVEEDIVDFQQEILPCDIVELHIINSSETVIPGDTFHKVCPNKNPSGNAISCYPIKLPKSVPAGGRQEAVYRFERHDGFINLFCWTSMKNTGDGGTPSTVMFQTMWAENAKFAYTDRIDYIHFAGLTLAAGVIIRIYGCKQ